MTQRLSNAKEASSKPAGLQSHEDLAKKLQVNLVVCGHFAFSSLQFLIERIFLCMSCVCAHTSFSILLNLIFLYRRKWKRIARNLQVINYFAYED